MNIRSVLLAILSFAALFMTLPALAADGYHIELGASSSSMNVSSSPVVGANMDAAGRPGLGLRFIGPIYGQPNMEYTLGLSQQRYDVQLAGGGLGGGPDTTTISGTVRYRMDMDPHFKPYVGLGVHNTNINSATFGGLNSGSANIAGVVAEVGARMPIDEKWYVDLNLSQKFGRATIPLTTSVGAVPVTTMTAKDPVSFTVAFGVTF